MLDCGQVLAELSNYLDGDISPDLKETLEKHLKKCHRCSLVYNTTRKTLQLVTESGALDIPLSSDLRLRVRVSEWVTEA